MPAHKFSRNWKFKISKKYWVSGETNMSKKDYKQFSIRRLENGMVALDSLIAGVVVNLFYENIG